VLRKKILREDFIKKKKKTTPDTLPTKASHILNHTIYIVFKVYTYLLSNKLHD
jgi:hypothetical protein